MAHVIIFLDAKTQQPIDDFFGYAQGIFYRAFDAAHCDAGCSGSGETVRRSAAQIRGRTYSARKRKCRNASGRH